MEIRRTIGHGRFGTVHVAWDPSLEREVALRAGHSYVAPRCFAYIHAGMNEIDQALEWQARTYDDGASPFNYFSPLIENLHADPRHSAEVQRMRLRLDESCSLVLGPGAKSLHLSRRYFGARRLRLARISSI